MEYPLKLTESKLILKSIKVKKLNDLFTTPKHRIINSDDCSYSDFRKSLLPRYNIIWRDISMAYFSLLLTSLLLLTLLAQYPSRFYFIIPLGALALGYGFACLQLFFHEASHYGLAANRRLNDSLGNIFIGAWVGQNINNYRVIHSEHHRYHGEVNDAEHSYFDALNLRYLLDSLLGIKVIKVLIGRRNLNKRQVKSNTNYITLLFGVTLHLIILISSYKAGYWAFSVIWILATASVCPLFLALRQLLEHRSQDSNKETNYTKVKHGKIHRLFGNSLLARTFGAAGFNRHLLHHWDPTLSYTRLQDAEFFLLNTPWADEIQKAQSTYTKTFRELYKL